jgi:DNA-binding NtrC family response regulator
MPPLRARREDIPDLISQFVRKSCERLHLPVPRLPVRELDKARDYDWPGNIRELQNAVERAVILARGGALELPLPANAQSHTTQAPQVHHELRHETDEVISERRWQALERANVMRALRHSGFRLYGARGAAELLGINPATLASRLKKLGIRVTELKRAIAEHSTPLRM